MARDAIADRLNPELRRYRVQGAERTLAALDASAGGTPWTEEQWAQSVAFDDCWLCSDRDRHLAAAVMQPAVDDIALLNLVVDRAWHRRGIASWVLRQLLDEYRRQKFRRCILEVRISNTPAQALYRKLGFEADGVRKNYYPAVDGREDALLMSFSLRSGTKEIT